MILATLHRLIFHPSGRFRDLDSSYHRRFDCRTSARHRCRPLHRPGVYRRRPWVSRCNRTGAGRRGGRLRLVLGQRAPRLGRRVLAQPACAARRTGICHQPDRTRRWRRARSPVPPDAARVECGSRGSAVRRASDSRSRPWIHRPGVCCVRGRSVVEGRTARRRHRNTASRRHRSTIFVHRTIHRPQ